MENSIAGMLTDSRSPSARGHASQLCKKLSLGALLVENPTPY